MNENTQTAQAETVPAATEPVANQSFAAFREQHGNEGRAGKPDPFSTQKSQPAADGAGSESAEPAGETKQGVEQQATATGDEAPVKDASGDNQSQEGDGKAQETKPGDTKPGDLPVGVKKRVNRLAKQNREKGNRIKELEAKVAAMESAATPDAKTAEAKPVEAKPAADAAKTEAPVEPEQPDLDEYADRHGDDDYLDKFLEDCQLYEDGKPMIHGKKADPAEAEPKAKAEQEPAKEPEQKAAQEVTPEIQQTIDDIKGMVEEAGHDDPEGLFSDLAHVAGQNTDLAYISDTVADYLATGEDEAAVRLAVMSTMIGKQTETRKIARLPEDKQIDALKKLAKPSESKAPVSTGTAGRAPKIGPARGGGNAPKPSLEDAGESFSDFRNTYHEINGQRAGKRDPYSRVGARPH